MGGVQSADQGRFGFHVLKVCDGLVFVCLDIQVMYPIRSRRTRLLFMLALINSLTTLSPLTELPW
ncbi:hypothetical protein BCR43DRAFT_348452 [Syncephalastrum racemosum]|uniref:Uncharacterized protein n=1 Tax=Syncephalastrum racemosum TaxID=13706 RepID=A0A1X2H5X7_SYNRA|nr:hypothetical protein BCR43DRAFT_348452 [Syncephalastrum racemosum]